MKNQFSFLIFTMILSLPFFSAVHTQTQIGSDIDGEAAFDESGRSVSISADGKRVAIGAPFNDGAGSDAIGQVRVYAENGGVWSQIGSDIDGEADLDQAGFSVSLSDDGKRVAIGALFNDGTGPQSGHVRIYEENGGGWSQIGSDIDGEFSSDRSGYSVQLSADGRRVAIGAIFNGVNNSVGENGHVRVYEESGGVWSQIGSDIDGESSTDQSGFSVALSDNGKRVAIGAPKNNNGNGNDAGHVRIYEENGGTWSQVGSDIDGEEAFDNSGHSVSLSSDGRRVAIGAILNGYNNGNGTHAGHVRIYEESGGGWSQIGSDIDGEPDYDEAGSSVSLSSDGKRVAIGAPYNDANGDHAGKVKIYEENGGVWSQVDDDIIGEGGFNYLGSSVSLSADGTRVAVGAPRNNGTGLNAGHTRVFSLTPPQNVPSCTQLISPANGATQVQSTVTLSWMPVPNVIGYRLTMGTTSGGSDILNQIDIGNQTSYTPSPLPPNSTIYIAITPYNNNGTATNCNEENFSTAGFEENLELYININNAAPGDMLAIPIKANNFIDVAGMQFSLLWDHSVLSYSGLNNFNLNNLEQSDFSEVNVSNGILTVVWFTSECETMPDNSTLFEIELTVIGDENTSSDISFSSTPTAISFFDCDVNLLEYSTTNGTVFVQSILEIASIDFTHLSCFGANDGAISLNITGGSGDFTIEWSNGDTETTIENLSAGIYSAEITDNATGTVISTGDIEVESPTEIQISTSTTPEMDGNANGTATATVSGGTLGYTYLWSDDQSQTTQTATGLSEGVYLVTVTDANMCVKGASAIVDSEISSPVPDNNDCINAEDINNLFGQALNVAQTSSIYTNEGADAVGNVAFGTDCFIDLSVDQTVWFSFTGDGHSYLIETSVCNSTNPIYLDDTQMAVYEGNNCSTLNAVDCNDDIDTGQGNYLSSVNIQTVDNLEYFILIDGYNYLSSGVADGEFCIEVTRLSANSSTEAFTEKSIRIFPNPVQQNDWLNIDLQKLDRNVKWEARLLNAQGTTLKVLEIPAGMSQVKMEIEQISAGIYFIEFNSDNASFYKKIIAQ